MTSRHLFRLGLAVLGRDWHPHNAEREWQAEHFPPAASRLSSTIAHVRAFPLIGDLSFK
jgi:hypothetical protein